MFKKLSALFATPLRAKVLTHFMRRPGEEGTAATLASLIGAPRRDVERAASALAEIGALISRRERDARHYRANDAHPLAGVLRALLNEALVLHEDVYTALFRKVRGITLLITAGILVSDTRSAVDLLIVCKDPRSTRVREAVRRIERLTAVPIRYAALTTEEFFNRRESYDRLIRDTLEFKHRTLISRLPRELS